MPVQPARRTAPALYLLSVSLALAAQTENTRAPRLLSPAADAQVPAPVAFRWAPVRGAVAYTLEVSRDELFTPPLVVDGSYAAMSQIVQLPEEGSFWWRVRAVFPNGSNGPWSDAREFLLRAPALAEAVLSVSLTPSSVTGGYTSQALITLSKPAPSGGASVALASSDSDVARPPGRAIVARGESSATVDIATSAVRSDVQVRITAAGRDSSRSATLGVSAPAAPAVLTSFGVVPATPAAGNDVVGTVTLAAPAPAPAGTVVRIASSDPSLVSAPATVRVPPGARAENFLIKTERDTANRSVAITASLGGITRTAAVSLRAAASSAALDAPALLTPAANGRGNVFSWSEVFGAVSYTIQIDDSPDFEAPLIIDRTVPAVQAAITPLPSGVLWWRVRANDSSGGAGQWSAARTLR